METKRISIPHRFSIDFHYVFGIGSSYYFQGILDFFIPNQARSTLNIISIGLIAVYLFRVLFEYSRSYLLIILGQRMSMAIMLQYFKHVLTLPMNFLLRENQGNYFSFS
ncbi:ABC transporter transmembrane domain-containing protein [Enterococcus faecium]|nr:ABC transporter transmembrane domain-containing protein [Enterococcus faecium]